MSSVLVVYSCPGYHVKWLGSGRRWRRSMEHLMEEKEKAVMEEKEKAVFFKPGGQ